MSTPHLPDTAAGPPVFLGVVPLGRLLGTVEGHRVELLSLECWDAWTDLRFARTDLEGRRRLTRRVPPAAAWRVWADGAACRVVDAVGRGDRTFSNGEVRLVPALQVPVELEVSVTLLEDRAPLTARARLRA